MFHQRSNIAGIANVKVWGSDILSSYVSCKYVIIKYKFVEKNNYSITLGGNKIRRVIDSR